MKYAISIVSDKTANEIWNIWINQKEWIIRECTIPPWNTPSELAMMRRLYNADGKVPRIDIGFPNRIHSYKMHIMKSPILLKTTSIVYFHGIPKIQQLYNKSFNIELLKNWV